MCGPCATSAFYCIEGERVLQRQKLVPKSKRYSSKQTRSSEVNFMQKRQLGKKGPLVSALGLGCMGMSFAYGPADEAESLRVLRRYLELGGNFLDTAEIYGPFTNEELLGRFLRDVPRDSVVVATKFGFKIDANQIRTAASSTPH